MLHNELLGQLGKETTMRVTHAHHSFIDIQSLGLQATKLVACHQIAIGFGCVEGCHSLDNLAVYVGRKRRNAIC